MVIHNSCTFVYAFALVCLFCLASSKETLKEWSFNSTLQLFSLLLPMGYVLTQKIWTGHQIFSAFFILFTQSFFQLKEGPGFIRYSTMKFLEEMLIYLIGWYFDFFCWPLIALCTLSWNWIESVNLVPYFYLEYQVIYETNLCGTEERLLYLKRWM